MSRNFLAHDDLDIWFITDEGIPGEIPPDNGLSLVGLFSSRKVALAYLREERLGDELADSIQWTVSSHNPDFWEGFRPDGRRYILGTEPYTTFVEPLLAKEKKCTSGAQNNG